MQSLERARAYQEDLQQLGRILDLSPRKAAPKQGSPPGNTSDSFGFRTPPSNRKGRVIMDEDVSDLRRRLGRVRSFGEKPFGLDMTNRTGSPFRPLPARASSSAMGFHTRRHGPPSASDGAADSEAKVENHKPSDVKKPTWPNDRWKPSWWDGRKPAQE